MPTIEGRFLLETNVLIYATLANDPRAERARDAIEQGRQPDCQAMVSVQNLAEMYPNLTGPKTDPPDTPAEASEKIARIASLPYVQVLPVTHRVVERALELAAQLQVRRRRYFDMQLAATLLLHDIPTIVTENAEDFADVPGIQAVNPFE